ncbi:hypothetical protein AYO40_01740 [Planctomycetaceae bacterium SCGC AG-212-D15]|nr:hypothetical protein AYO40_01740 [Planctomycetaceae bacterium SCGC AG-212-D15]
MASGWSGIIRFYEELCSQYGWRSRDQYRPMEALVKWASNQAWAERLFPGTSLNSLCIHLVPGYNPELPFFSAEVIPSGQFRFRLWMKVGQEICERTCTSERTEDVFKEFFQLLHCVVGPLPFRSTSISPSCLSPTVAALARTTYDEGLFDRLPILADALEDAGCNEPTILEHCRGSGPHIRGCWVIDLILDKK